MNIRKLKVVLLLVAIILSASFCGAADPNSSDLRQKKIESLISRINELGFYQDPPEEIRRDPNKMKNYWPEQHKKREQYEAQREKAQSELAAMGDDAIDLILQQTYPQSNIFYAPVLAEIGTDRAMEALRQKAMDGSSYAAKIYTQKLKDKTKAKGLLDSKDISVRRAGLSALRGTAIDSNLLTRLNEFLSDSKNPYEQRSAAEVMADDPNSTFAEQKVSAIIRTIDTVPQLPRAWEKFQYNRFGSLADIQYQSLTDSLCKMKGADGPLREITNKVNGLTRDCVIVARAYHGDVSVKPQVYRFLRDPSAVNLILLRLLAVGSFARIGDNSDIEFLKDIAENDPVEIVNCGGPLVELINGQLMFPDENIQLMITYEPKTWDRCRSDSRFFIRPEAKKMIKLIVSKQKQKDQKKKAQ